MLTLDYYFLIFQAELPDYFLLKNKNNNNVLSNTVRKNTRGYFLKMPFIKTYCRWVFVCCLFLLTASIRLRCPGFPGGGGEMGEGLLRKLGDCASSRSPEQRVPQSRTLVLAAVAQRRALPSKACEASPRKLCANLSGRVLQPLLPGSQIRHTGQKYSNVLLIEAYKYNTVCFLKK